MLRPLRITLLSLQHIQRRVTSNIGTYILAAPNTAKLSNSISQHTASVLFAPRAYSTSLPEEKPEKGQESDPQNSQPEAECTDPVRMIYRFPHIKFASTLTKVKFFQTAIVVGAVPYLYGGYLNGMVTYGAMLSSIGLMSVATIMLYVVADLISKIICILKYNKVTREVHISHITFWGRRRNVILDLANIIPISDSSENITDTYIKVNTYDKSESFLIFIKDIPEEERNQVLRILG